MPPWTLEEMDLTETRYTLAAVEPGAVYYWRVRTINAGGISDWAAYSFTTAAPMIEIVVPNGGEQWQRGLPVFIRWHGNIEEDLIVELYKADTLVQSIENVSSVGAYEWEVTLDLEPGDDYSMKIKSSVDEMIADSSDTVFTIW